MSVGPGASDASCTSTSTASTYGLVAKPSDHGPVFSLVVQHGGDTAIAALIPGLPLIVGRAASHGLRIEDSTLSREHARFELVGDHVAVTDLGSKNGVLLDQRRVQHAELASGAIVMLGAVCVRVQVLGCVRHPTTLDDDDEFRRRVEEELVRARAFRRPFGLLHLRAVDHTAASSRTPAWIEAVRSRLRPVDHIAHYGPRAVQILLPEMGLAAAAQLAHSLVGPLLERRVQPGIGLSIHAGDDDGAEVLIERSRQAAHRASPANPVEISPTEAWLLGGDSRETLAGDMVVGCMRSMLGEVERVAPSRLPIILHGETGTGKEVLARLIHERSPRRAKPMVRVNCGAIAKDLVESTLFGYERGAFTGAHQQQRGVFEEASGGTVFLDEIGELPLTAQVALLRVLETGSFQRVGSVRELTVDVRIVAATHRDLEAMTISGGFRHDLYYRLSGITIEIAPLRDRSEDVEPIALHFLALANAANGRAVQGITAGALAVLRNYRWPGNVRELRNTIERAVVVTSGELIGEDDLPLRMRATARGSGDAVQRVAEPTPSDARAIRGSVQRYEADRLRAVLQATDWNRNEAAQQLEIPVRTLSYRMKRLGIRKPPA